MINQLLLSKVGIFDVEPTRQSATKRLLKNFRVGDHCWFLDNDGLRIANAFSHYKKSMSKLVTNHGLNMPRESGFDIHATNGPSIAYSSLLITKHALERWTERASQNFPSINELDKINETMASKAIYEEMPLSLNFGNLELFYPFGEGAFIIEIIQTSRSEMDSFMNSVSYAKQTCCIANWNYNKKTKSWHGEFIPRGGMAVVKTYLGWNQLKKGGTFNAMDWYKQNMEWAEFDNKYKQKLIDLGIEL